MQQPKLGRLNDNDIQRTKQDPQDSSALEQIQNLIDDKNESSNNIEVKKVDIVVGSPWATLTPSTGLGQVVYAKLYDGSVEIDFDYYGGPLVGPPVAWTQANVVTLPQSCRPHIAINHSCSDSYFVTVRGFSGLMVIATNGQISFFGTGTLRGRLRFMPSSNAPVPMTCFPVNVKTRFKTPPRAVVALRATSGDKDSKRASGAPLVPFWRFINSTEGPTVQILNIQGLEYDSKQKIDLVIIGDL